MTHPPEFEILAEQLFDASQEFLQQMDGFHPHAAFIDAQGKPEMLAAYCGEHPKAEEVHDALLAHFHEHAREKGYRAIGIAADGRATNPSGGPKTDAILVFLEAPGGHAITIAMQYRKGPEGYEYAPTFGFARKGEVFTE